MQPRAGACAVPCRSVARDRSIASSSQPVIDGQSLIWLQIGRAPRVKRKTLSIAGSAAERTPRVRTCLAGASRTFGLWRNGAVCACVRWPGIWAVNADRTPGLASQLCLACWNAGWLNAWLSISAVLIETRSRRCANIKWKSFIRLIRFF